MVSDDGVVVNFRLSRRLYDLVKSHAAGHNVTMSEYIRITLLLDMIMSSNEDALNYFISLIDDDVLIPLRTLISKHSPF